MEIIGRRFLDITESQPRKALLLIPSHSIDKHQRDRETRAQEANESDSSHESQEEVIIQALSFEDLLIR